MQNEFMTLAIKMAKKARDKMEIPVGAVVVYQNNQVLSCGFNTREIDNSIVGHAEINALNDAAKQVGSWKLDECVMYVTVEPCLMCYGAIVQSRIKKVYIGSKQDTLKKLSYKKYISKNDIIIDESLLNDESAQLMKEFFKQQIREKNVGYKTDL